MKKKLLDTIIIGFALFAIFFGAGNLIFPPYLGVTAGENWGIATLAFLISDPLLSIIAVMVVAALGGSALNVGRINDGIIWKRRPCETFCGQQ